jgi:hypothetical protein
LLVPFVMFSLPLTFRYGVCNRWNAFHSPLLSTKLSSDWLDYRGGSYLCNSILYSYLIIEIYVVHQWTSLSVIYLQNHWTVTNLILNAQLHFLCNSQLFRVLWFNCFTINLRQVSPYFLYELFLIPF